MIPCSAKGGDGFPWNLKPARNRCKTTSFEGPLFLPITAGFCTMCHVSISSLGMTTSDHNIPITVESKQEIRWYAGKITIITAAHPSLPLRTVSRSADWAN